MGGSANEDLGLKPAYNLVCSDTLSARAGAFLQTFGKLGRGPLKNSVSTAALVAAALFCSGIFDGAQAQFFPWNNGGWGNGGWDDRPRRPVRRIPRNVEDDGEKINSTLPKPTGPLVLVV